jgi:hypothetical protein
VRGGGECEGEGGSVRGMWGGGGGGGVSARRRRV